MREQKRASKASAREQRKAELARLEEETAGKQLGFRVFNDGTIERDSAIARGSAWLLSGMGQPALLGPPGNRRQRSAVLDATLDDRRVRKPFTRARGLASDTTLGLLGGGRDHYGEAVLTIVTNDWVEVITASEDSEVAALDGLNALLQRAKRASRSESEALPEPSPPPSNPPVTDVPGALRELKDLHDEALLTDDEYESRRQQLVAQLPTSAEVSTPAGWHPDPYGKARLRWWDGHRWSDHTAPWQSTSTR